MTVMVGLVSIVVSSALIFVVTGTQRTSAAIGNAMESVLIVQDAEIEILRHGHVADPADVRASEDRLLDRLDDAAAHADTELERSILSDANWRVQAYLQVAGDPEASAEDRDQAHMWAYRGIDHLAAVNIDQSRAERERADTWSRRATFLGITGAVLLVVLSMMLVWWLRRRAFVRLGDAMKRVARGELDVRARETGPAEVRAVMHGFNRMADALAEQRSQQMRYLAGVAHDLRSPLAALRSTIDLIDPERPLPSEEGMRRAVARISRQLSTLDRMVGDLLHLARLEAKELDVQLEPRDLRDLVRDVVDLMAPTAARHHIEMSLPEEPAMCQCDPLRIEQMLANLVSNAIKYSPQGGPVLVAVQQEDDLLVVAVTDQGIGIAPADLDHLFEPFHRMGGEGRHIPGFGVGLYVVRRIVEAHHGRIEVASTPGQGSTFRVYLPPARPAPADALGRVAVAGITG